MARPRKGPRLYRRRDQWVILDGKTERKTGTTDEQMAASLLLAYIAGLSGGSPVLPTPDPMKKRRATYHMVRRAHTRAAAKGLPFGISEEDVAELMVEQNHRCALSGMPFSNAASKSGRRMPFAPSIDRIDNSLGYTRENIRILASIVNNARADYTDEEFALMCRSVVASRHFAP